MRSREMEVKKYGDSWIISLDRATRKLLNITELGQKVTVTNYKAQDEKPKLDIMSKPVHEGSNLTPNDIPWIKNLIEERQKKHLLAKSLTEQRKQQLQQQKEQKAKEIITLSQNPSPTPNNTEKII